MICQILQTTARKVREHGSLRACVCVHVHLWVYVVCLCVYLRVRVRVRVRLRVCVRVRVCVWMVGHCSIWICAPVANLTQVKSTDVTK